MFIVLPSNGDTIVKIHSDHLRESWLVPGGCRLADQAANLTFKADVTLTHIQLYFSTPKTYECILC